MSSSRHGMPSVTSSPEEVWEVITFTNPCFTPLCWTTSSTFGVMLIASSDFRDCTLIFSSLIIMSVSPPCSPLSVETQQPAGVFLKNFFQTALRQRQRPERVYHILDFNPRVIRAKHHPVAQAALQHSGRDLL